MATFKSIAAVVLFPICLFAAPLQWFEPNAGQARDGVEFLGPSISLSDASAVISDGRHTVVIALAGANHKIRTQALDRLPGVSNYYTSGNPKNWRIGIEHYARILYRSVYPGIDEVFYYDSRAQLEFDFLLAPGADPAEIQLSYSRAVKTDGAGDLLIGEIRQQRPKVYQNGREIPCQYLVRDEHTVRIALASYDRTQALTIDPTIVYSTYLGGNAQNFANALTVDGSGSVYVTGALQSPSYPGINPSQDTSQLIVVAKFQPDGQALQYYTYVGGTALNESQAIALDASGSAYVAGFTASKDFPVMNAAQPASGGGTQNAFIFKLSPNGKLMYSTYLGGNNQDEAFALAVDSTGAAFVAGFTFSIDFPVKKALQSTMTGRPDAFVAKLSPDGGEFEFATYLGGNSGDYGESITLDGSGNPVIVGQTSSTDFPIENAFQATLDGATVAYPDSGFITKLSSAGDKIVYSSYLGPGSAYVLLNQVAVDSSGSILVAGQVGATGLALVNPIQPAYGGGPGDLVVAKLNPQGNSATFITYFGGSETDLSRGLAVDLSGNIYVSGYTFSTDFPVKDSLQTFGSKTHGYKDDAFLIKISPTGSLIYSTLVGGDGDDRASGVALDSQGAIYLAGSTSSDNFPVKNALQAAYGGGSDSMYVMKLAPDVVMAPAPVVTSVSPGFIAVGSGSTLVTITGSGFMSGAAVELNGTPLSAVLVSSTTLQFTLDASQLQQPATLAFTVVNPQSPPSTPISLVVGYPTPQFTAASVVNAASYTGGPVAPGEIVTIFGTNFGTAANTEVLFDNAVAELVYAGATQLSATVPYSVAGQGRTSLVVKANGISSAPLTLAIAPSAPAIFTSDASGKGQAASENQDYSINGPSNPAAVGSAIALYGTGGGPLTADALPRLMLAVSAAIGGVPAQVLYAGIAPGLVQGAMQINLQLPAGVSGSAVPVVIKVGGALSNTVTIAVK